MQNAVRVDLELHPNSRHTTRRGIEVDGELTEAPVILRTLARDIATGKQKVVEMKSAVDVDDAEVQKMVEESVEHFFDDVRARQWVEAKLKATETVSATKNALAECAAEIDAGYQTQVEAALAAVESLIAAEDPKTQSGDPARLKAATTTLDEVTKPLADVLMDKAMDAMLRKRGLIQ